MIGDLDAEIDGLVNRADASQSATASEVIDKAADDNLEAALQDCDILGSIAAEYNLDEQCKEVISPKLADIVKKLLQNRSTEGKLKEKLNQSTCPKNCDKITGIKVNIKNRRCVARIRDK